MADELVFYTNPMSRGRLVRWMLEEVGQPYRTEIIDYATNMKAPAYLAINPMGKVPALRHGETVVTEAAAICAYLADAFPPPPGSRRPPAITSVALTIVGCSSPPVRSSRRPRTVCSASSYPRTRSPWSAMADTISC